MRVPVEFRIALRALGRHKMRSGLAVLGISIGVAAYIASVSVGRGAAQQVQAQLSALGENILQIEAGSRTVSGVRTGSLGTRSLVASDMDAIRAQVPLIARLSANVDTRVHAVRGNQNWATQVRGVSPEYLQIRKWSVDRGAPFGDEDVVRLSKVCLIGQTVATNLFGDEDPVGQEIQVQKLPCKVTGVLRAKGTSAWGQDQDDIVLMPYTTVQKKIMGVYWLDDIFCSATSVEAIQPAQEQIAALLRERHGSEDFNLRSPTAMMQAREQAQQVMTILLASIASVALLVGGIGIMNIMLASVTERTREIGIRLAVGARERDILLQFLAESLTLSMAGGAAGIVLGLLGSLGLSLFAKWPTSVQPLSVLVAVGFAGAVGVIFGSYPAVRASRLDPVDALGR